MGPSAPGHSVHARCASGRASIKSGASGQNTRRGPQPYVVILAIRAQIGGKSETFPQAAIWILELMENRWMDGWLDRLKSGWWDLIDFCTCRVCLQAAISWGEIYQCELNLSTFLFIVWTSKTIHSYKCPRLSNILTLTSLLRVERHISHKTRQKSSAGGEIIWITKRPFWKM